MTYWLSQAQTELYEEGGWAAWRVEEDVLEDLDRQHVQEPTVVVLADGIVAFWVTKQGVRI